MTKNSVPCRVEFLNIIISKNNSALDGTILDRIMGSCDPEVLIDQVKETVLFLGFLFLQTDSSFEVRIWMILFSAEAILASSTSKSGIRIPLTDNED